MFVKLGRDTITPELGVMYVTKIEGLGLKGTSGTFYSTEGLRNGRGSYVFIEDFVRAVFGLEKGGGDYIDHLWNGRPVEQKAYDPKKKDKTFHVAASKAFSANNGGPIISELVKTEKYNEALKFCKELGYDKNDFYVLTGSAQFEAGSDLEIIFLSREDILKNLDKKDPRKMPVENIYKLVKRTQEFTFG